MSRDFILSPAKNVVLSCALSIAFVSLAAEASWSPGAEELEGLLGEHVAEGLVDYRGLAANRGTLDDYLDTVAEADPSRADASDALAFWINSYNAATLGLVVERYPEIRSVMDVRGFFKERWTRIAGELLSLDEIEQRALSFGDARVHFAVVCASFSCPELRPEPYEGRRLDQQLDEQTRDFLADPEKGAAFDERAGVLSLSSIFKWYGGDFTGGTDLGALLARGRLVEWVLPYLPADLRDAVAASEPAVRFIDYDWQLNESPRKERSSSATP